MEKQCRKCGLVKISSEFYANPQKKDGLASYCKECHKKDVNARYVRREPRERPAEGFKKCSHCQEVKPVSEFGSNKSTSDGLQWSCKPCCVKIATDWRKKHPEYHRESAKKYYRQSEKIRQRHYDNSVRHRIGKHVEHGTYERLFAEQSGKCAICGTDKPGPRVQRFHIDHCHASNAVRGLLCHNCNALLGHARDDSTILAGAIVYLRKHQDKEGG